MSTPIPAMPHTLEAAKEAYGDTTDVSEKLRIVKELFQIHYILGEWAHEQFFWRAEISVIERKLKKAISIAAKERGE